MDAIKAIKAIDPCDLRTSYTVAGLFIGLRVAAGSAEGVVGEGYGVLALYLPGPPIGW